MRVTRGRVRGELQVTSDTSDMARDSPEPQPSVRRKKPAPVKENKRVTRKDKKNETIKDQEDSSIPTDIQKELSQKLENLLERDRLGVSS